MTYVFACPKCKETKELSLKIIEYEKMKEALDFPLCKCCEIRMNRLYTPPSFLGSTGGYDAVAGTASWQNS